MNGWNFQNSYLTLPSHFYQQVLPTPVRLPQLALINHELAQSLGIEVSKTSTKDLANYFSGNSILSGSTPIAQAYAGHQFAHFTMLGDGRAILLGEQITPSGLRFDIQLKGSGPTPYSRRGDGRAAIGPMIREYIISEAMHALGIPTTRSLAVVSTGEPVYRESTLNGAILTRVSQSHIRVGTFQFASGTNREDGLKKLADYTIERHDPNLTESKTKYLDFLRSVIDRQAKLVSQWMMVGFIHGVMNTDNMSICGETIDYGPCAFLDRYHPDTVFSSIDRHGRYAYGNQPVIAQWNLARFAESILPLLSSDRAAAVVIAKESVDEFPKIFIQYWLEGMRKKLGIITPNETDLETCNTILSLMVKHESDYTQTFRALSTNKTLDGGHFQDPEFISWNQQWKSRIQKEGRTVDDALLMMQQHNPAVIPRNHLVEEALQAASESGEYRKTEELVAALKNPFVETTENAYYRNPPSNANPDYQTFCGT